MDEKVTTVLIDALKRAMEEADEVRLFRSGKLPGLFPSRTGSNIAAAEIAVREGMLEVIRSETKGRTQTDWVRPTPKAVEFIHSKESPVVALHELRNILQITQEGLPGWVEELRTQIDDLANNLSNEVQAIARRLEVLTLRVHEAIERAEAAQPELSEELSNRIPWGNDVLAYLDRRNDTGTDSMCTLSELYHFLRHHETRLTIPEFHTGLRRLADRGILRLHPHNDNNGFPEPEYALLDGIVMYFYVTRGMRAA